MRTYVTKNELIKQTFKNSLKFTDIFLLNFIEKVLTENNETDENGHK